MGTKDFANSHIPWWAVWTFSFARTLSVMNTPLSPWVVMFATEVRRQSSEAVKHHAVIAGKENRLHGEYLRCASRKNKGGGVVPAPG